MRDAITGNLAMTECTEAGTGVLRYVICAVARDGGILSHDALRVSS
nr:DUF6117 family protein [Sphingomonas bacterium]